MVLLIFQYREYIFCWKIFGSKKSLIQLKKIKLLNDKYSSFLVNINDNLKIKLR